MSAPRVTFARVLAAVTSTMVVTMVTCDRGCSSEPIEQVPRFAALLPREPTAPTPSEPVHDASVPSDDPSTKPPEKVATRPKPIPRSTDLDGLVIADDVTPVPTSAEWMAAPSMHTTHPHCRARLVREWMTVLCTTTQNTFRQPLSEVRVVTGDAGEVTQWTHSAERPDDWAFPPTTSAAIFPVRRGDRRLLEILFVALGAHPRFDAVDAYTVSVVWLEGMKSPDITVTE